MITAEQKRLVVRVLKPLATRVFCATGEGGGIDPTCSPDEASGGWSPSMSRSDAENWVKNSKYKKDVMHVTLGKSEAASIEQEGFRTDIPNAGKAFGSGVYFAIDAKTTQFYKDLTKEDGHASPVVVTAKVDVKNMLEIDTTKWNDTERDIRIMPLVAAKKIGKKTEYFAEKSEISRKNQQIISEYNKTKPKESMQSYQKRNGFVDYPEAEAFKAVVTKAGYDSILVKDRGKIDGTVGGNQLLVFNSKSVVVIKSR